MLPDGDNFATDDSLPSPFLDVDGAFWFDKIIDPLETTALLATDSHNMMPAATGISIDDADHALDELQKDELPPPKKKRGRGRQKSNLTAEERKIKNKEIQARYRTKQKMMRSELESTHSQISQELVNIRSEITDAKETNEVLEKMLIVKDVAVNMLERGARAQASIPSTISIDAEPSKNTDVEDSAGQNSDEPEKSKKSSDSSSLPLPIVQSLYQTFSSDLGAPVRSIGEAYLASERLHSQNDDFANRNPQYAALSNAVRTLSGHQLVQGWRRFSLELRHIFEKHEQELSNGLPASKLNWNVGHPPDLLLKIMPLFEEQVVIISTALRYNLSAIQALFETASEVGPDPISYWRDIASKLDISPQQHEKLVYLWKGYLARVASLRSHRINLVESLKHVENSPANRSIGNLNLMMQRYCNLFDSSGKLAGTPDSELLAMIELMKETGNVWTMFQRAKIVALAYPAFPDTVQFLRAVADDNPTFQNNLPSLPTITPATTTTD